MRAVLALALLLGLTGVAVAQPIPQHGPDRHVGMTSCGSSTCHGSIEPWRNSAVQQNEFVTWSQQDRHASAYKTLLGEASQRIARNLNIGPAHEAPLCLNCHTHFPAAEKRGPRFQVSEGVSCEACHGAGERWLGVHASLSGSSRDSLPYGRYPTEDPVARARLCLSCHLGDRTKSVTHSIMGAGHPRLSFELDTFATIQPAHHQIDGDYARRKPMATNGVQTWAIGQAMALSGQMAMLANPARNRDGIFPELTLFDCHACHRRTSNIRWEPRASVGLPPGVPRLADGNLTMLRILATQIAPPLGARLREHGVALNRATLQNMDATMAAAAALKQVADELVTVFAAHRFGAEDMRALLRGVLDEGLQRGEYFDYAAAEQATMATGSILAALRRLGITDQLDAMDKAQEALLAATAEDEQYRADTFRRALGDFRVLLSSRASLSR